jgi:predicted MPP superfamily phosphohydrolase
MEVANEQAAARARLPAGTRGRVAAAVIVVVLLSVWVGGHLYLAWGLVLGAGLASGTERICLAVLGLLGASLVLQPIAEWRFGPRATRPLSWIASLWMGFVFYLILLLFLSDAAALVAGASFERGAAGGRARAVAVVGAAGALAALSFAATRRPPRVRRREVASPRWPVGLDGFRIVQISDVHIGPLLDREFAADVAARVHRLAPDLIVVTGDLVDGTVDHLRDEVAPLGELAAPHGVWFVTGNHDFYSGAVPWLEHLRSLGMRTLQNERVAIEAPGGAFDLAGVNDRMGALFGPEHASDVSAALRGWDRERPVVLLAHDPTTFHEAWRHGIDLQISGHTHGGQLWPFGVFVKLFVGYVAGHYRRGEAQLLVSCGTGFWGPPMRLGAPAEITEIVLRAEAR